MKSALHLETYYEGTPLGIMTERQARDWARRLCTKGETYRVEIVGASYVISFPPEQPSNEGTDNGQ